MENLFNNLNERQMEAVKATEGPVLVVAGAGSGKTTVIVNRIAYIIGCNRVNPSHILAITFTNKAAREMRNRVDLLLGDTAAGMWIGTFHSMCVRILRSCIDFLGFGCDFIIYDSADTRTVVKECLKELELDERNFPPRSVLSIISNAKNDMMDAATFENVYKNDFRMKNISEIYKKYQAKLKQNNAVDFDDIILYTVKILSLNNDVKLYYQSKFEYVLVDEYQDTNNAQYMLIHLLSDGYKNICVVGDDDQSIYKFRGANIGNILRFESDYEDTKKIVLEQNYRSTQNILSAANAVISNNGKRMEKKLWTNNGNGDKILLYTAPNEYEEGKFIADSIRKHYEDGGKFSDFAILYRTNAQSRVIEEMLMRGAVPYKVLAGLRFYDRKEIKDIISYLRFILNQNDDVSLKRIINEPKRQLGNTTIGRVEMIAESENVSMYTIVSGADRYDDLRGAAARLKSFADMMDDLIKLKDNIPLTDLITRVLTDTGYSASLMVNEEDIENKTRLENLNEFLSAAQEFIKNDEYTGTLAEFLENITLVSDVDEYDEEQDSAVLMTIHSSKGLEFNRVFLAGLEEGIFPGMRSIEGGQEEIEEERRLCYVAMTRAKKQLYITKTIQRTFYGKTAVTRPSRFFNEIPSKYIDDVSGIESKAYNTLKKSNFDFNYDRKRFEYARSSSDNVSMNFNEGDVVEHRKFGIGTVVSAQPFGKDVMLEIEFETIGVKRLMAAFAKLKKL